MEPLGPSVEHEVASRMEVSNNYNRSGPLGWTKDRKGDSTKTIRPKIQHVLPGAVKPMIPVNRDRRAVNVP